MMQSQLDLIVKLRCPLSTPSTPIAAFPHVTRVARIHSVSQMCIRACFGDFPTPVCAGLALTCDPVLPVWRPRDGDAMDVIWSQKSRMCRAPCLVALSFRVRVCLVRVGVGRALL
jgi:hypothetical protein